MPLVPQQVVSQGDLLAAKFSDGDDDDDDEMSTDAAIVVFLQKVGITPNPFSA